MNLKLVLFLFVITMTTSEDPLPGKFVWKPQLNINLLKAKTTTAASRLTLKIRLEDIRAGLVVLIRSYDLGITFVAFSQGRKDGATQQHLNPFTAPFYTNAWRWGRRYIALVQEWLGGKIGHFCNTHKYYKRRFDHMDEFIPNWLTYLLPVPRSQWKKEREDYKLFKHYSEPKFAKYYRYPSKVFHNFSSFESVGVSKEEGISSGSVEI